MTGQLDELLELMGGQAACERVSKLFHARIAGDAALRPLFPRDMQAVEERLAHFLVELLGGPAIYTERRGKNSLRCRHAHLPIGPDEANRWLGHMHGAILEAGIPDRVAERLQVYFAATIHTLADPFLPYYTLPLSELAAALECDSSMVEPDDLGRSLLSRAALDRDAERVRMLLQNGADPRAMCPLGHDALYQAVRGGGRERDGLAIVALLVEAGADVNHVSGPTRGTALHMAARRGHARMADALIAAGADIEVEDNKGATPLRRAVNCGKVDAVRLLLARGANPLSLDHHGVSPLAAARNEAIRTLLKDAVSAANP